VESYRELIDRMAHKLPGLPPQVHKVATYILENPGAVGTLSMRKLADKADVPPPTLPRLAKVLDYATYDEFRNIFRNHLQGQATGYAGFAGQLQRLNEEDDTAVLLSTFRQASLQNIEHLFATLDIAVIEEVVDKLISARKVFVVGMQASLVAASYFQYVGGMARGNWELLENRNGDIAERVMDMNEEDVLVAIAVPPCARESIIMAEFARDRGVPVIGITNSHTTALAARADTILIVAMQSPQFFESYVTTFLLLEILIGLVVARGGQEVVNNIGRVEESRRALGEYWEENSISRTEA